MIFVSLAVELAGVCLSSTDLDSLYLSQREWLQKNWWYFKKTKKNLDLTDKPNTKKGHKKWKYVTWWHKQNIYDILLF